jgi:cyclopropane fatty-acyl-phospholipid synthase-like methyltransferase
VAESTGRSRTTGKRTGRGNTGSSATPTRHSSRQPVRRCSTPPKLRPGERVLDVGCGFGTSTLEAAERVAPSGRVVGVDITAAVLQPALQRVAAAGVDNVELNFAPYAGQQGVVMDATAWLVTAHR